MFFKMSEEPIKVSLEALGVTPGLESDAAVEYDLGSLSAYDPTPLDDPEALRRDPDAALQALAEPLVQSLVNRLFELPAERVPQGRVADLPRPTTPLPRAKPLPKPKEPTKWEKFAKLKGITKKKRGKLVQDELSGDWKRRHGYDRANPEGGGIPIVDAGPDDQQGEDPFSKGARDKKKRVERQEKARLKNAKNAAKAGALPPTLKLAASLDDKGGMTGSGAAGPLRRRKDAKAELEAASRQVATSTASLGKFDRVVKGEDLAQRRPAAKKRKTLAVADKTGAERAATSKLVDSIIRRSADDVQLDAGKAISRFEADMREDRHRMKMKGDNKKGRLSNPGGAGAKGGVRKGGKPAGGRPSGGRGGGKGGGKGRK